MTSHPTRERPVLFLLHALGGSARAWQGVAAELAEDFESIAVDLPGFGDSPTATTSPTATDLTVDGMAGYVAAIVGARGASRWLLVGHSMGGKVATVLAARTLGGEAGLFGLAGVVLLAGSPASPEPMDEARRDEMIGWAAGGGLDDAAARAFVDANVGAPLTPDDDRSAIADLKRTTRDAWLAWLQRGSREDWSQEVGRLDLPALIVAGGADGDLGEAGQRATNCRVYPRARLQVLDGAGHLLPFERPQAVAAAIRRFWQEDAGPGPVTPVAYARLIASSRVNRRMRAALAARALADDPRYASTVLTAAQLTTLRAVAARVVPQSGPAIDLAARVAAKLAQGAGDGWRFAALPSDAIAYASALNGLGGFAESPADRQDARLADIAAGRFVPEPHHAACALLSAEQMRLWFIDACNDLATHWLAHPATMAHIGFDGFANGGDGPRPQGFERLAADEHEAWEPMAEAAR